MVGHDDEDVYVTVTAGYAGHVERKRGFFESAIEDVPGARSEDVAAKAAERAAQGAR